MTPNFSSSDSATSTPKHSFFTMRLNFGIGGQKEDNFEERNKPNCCELAIWLILLVIRLGAAI